MQTQYGGDPFDVGIMKLTPNGANKVYATYLGGSNSETPASMIADAQGNLVVLGRTYSPDFPFKTTAGNGGGADIFVAKISADGTKLIGCLRVGGAQDDGVNIEDQLRHQSEQSNSLIRNYGDDSRSEVILDGSNNILVVSNTQSSAPQGNPQAFPIVGTGLSAQFWRGLAGCGCD